jgi:hypothetical protein
MSKIKRTVEIKIDNEDATVLLRHLIKKYQLRDLCDRTDLYFDWELFEDELTMVIKDQED